MQVTIQSIPASLQEFETLAASGKQPERICDTEQTLHLYTQHTSY